MDDIQPTLGDPASPEPEKNAEGCGRSKAPYFIGVGLFIAGNLTGYLMGRPSKTEEPKAPPAAEAPAAPPPAEVKAPAPAPKPKAKKPAHKKAPKAHKSKTKKKSSQ